MNINSYIDKYGNYSFNELEFNDIDNVIFSALSYINYKDILVNSHIKMTIGEVGNIINDNYNKYKRDILAVRNALKLIKSIKDTVRYKDIVLYNYVYESGSEEQFGVISIEINKELVYVSYEGTDQLISGWKEDFMFSYMFPTISHKRAIRYINRNFLFSNKKIILGGHSKGGHLALVAGMYANIFVRNKIIKIYSNDGPGLLESELKSKRYDRIKDKLVYIIPDYTIIGMLYNSYESSYTVIKSMKKNVYSHDYMTWVVDDKKFKSSKLSLFSKSFHERLMSWINKYSIDERRIFVFSLFLVFENTNIKSLMDIKEHRVKILDFLKNYKNTDKNTKKMIREFIFLYLDAFRDNTIGDVKNIFKHNKLDS